MDDNPETIDAGLSLINRASEESIRHVVRSIYNEWAARQRLALARIAIGVTVLSIVIWAAIKLRDVITPFAVSFFLAAMLDPIVERMKRRGVSRIRAVASIYLLTFSLLCLAIVLIARYSVPQMRDLADNLPRLTHTATNYSNELWLQYQRPLGMVGIKQNPFVDSHGPAAKALASVLDAFKASVAGLAGQLLWLIIIPLSLYFFLMEYDRTRRRLIALFPKKLRPAVDRMSVEVVEIFSHYIRGLAKVCFLYGLVATIILMIFRVPYWQFLGMAAALLYAVPYVGPVIAIGASAMVEMNSTGSSTTTGILVVALLVMHFTFDYGVTPRVVGGSVGLHPVVNIFALMSGAALFGVWGMLFAVPVAASIQMLILYLYPQLREEPKDETTDALKESIAENADSEVVTVGGS